MKLNRRPGIERTQCEAAVLDRPVPSDGRYRFRWGKYQGLSVAEVQRCDPSYLDWVLREFEPCVPAWRAVVAFRDKR